MTYETDSSQPPDDDAVNPALAHCKVLLVEPNRQQLKKLRPVLRSLVGTIEHREVLEDFPEDGDYDLVVMTYDALTEDQRSALIEEYGSISRQTDLLLLSAGKVDYPTLFQSRTLTNLLAKNSDDVNVEELIVTTKKILTNDIFGIEKYFSWGVEPKVIRVSSTAQRQELLEAAHQYAEAIGINSRLVNRLYTVTDELVTNALYNSPVDAEGKRLFAHLPRSEPVDLPDGRYIEVKLCSDGRRLGVSTHDPYGSITGGHVLDYLAKCFRREDDQVDTKPGGAGLGLYYIFDSVTHFVVNIQHGVRSEFIGLISIDGSLRDFKLTNKSFNLFVEPRR